MKILIILDHPFPPNVRVENEMKSLSEAGNDVHVACVQKDSEPLVENTSYGTVHRRPMSKFIYKTSVGVLKFPFYFNYWRRFVDELFEKESFEAIHICDLPLARIGYEAKCKYGVRFVLDLFENWPVLLQLSTHTNTFLGKLLSSFKQWVRYEIEMCKLADTVIVVVEEAKARIEALGISPEKIIVISNTLDLQQFDVPERRNFNVNEIRMLYVGGINYHRGIQYVIKAISVLKQNNIPVHFDLVGNGSYLADIKNLINELHVQDNVTIHGFKPFTQIQDLYASANVALIPHIKSDHTDNTIPNKIFQYMYAEIPMVVSDCNPLMRIINETNSGVSYRYDHPEELVAIITDLYYHPEHLKDYTKFGRQAVIEKYNWKFDGERLVNLYKSM